MIGNPIDIKYHVLPNEAEPYELSYETKNKWVILPVYRSKENKFNIKIYIRSGIKIILKT